MTLDYFQSVISEDPLASKEKFEYILSNFRSLSPFVIFSSAFIRELTVKLRSLIVIVHPYKTTMSI